jgi:galactose mutarotase-like enzyme
MSTFAAQRFGMKRNESSIHETRQGSLRAFVLENALLRVTILPELGGKIASLVRLESGNEFLLQPPKPERLRARIYGDSFEKYEASGFDECAPTVARCVYPEGLLLGRRLPDHGDIWSLPSDIEVAGEQVRLTTHLRSLPLRFSKTLELQENTLRLEYEAANLSQSMVKFQWSAHPLLRVEPGAEIILPEEVRELELGWSADERMGKPGTRCTWPTATDSSGRKVKLNRIASPRAGTAEKFFTPRLSEGLCGMFLPQAEEGIAFRFDPQLVPYLGIWICQGGWPTSRSTKHFTAALEPCMGRHDSLEEGIKRNECAVLDGNESMQWWMEIEVTRGAPRSLRI